VYNGNFDITMITLNRILNRITEVTSGCWWLVVVNAIPISDICHKQQNISSVLNKNFPNLNRLLPLETNNQYTIVFPIA
jgi:hypothetical protein